MNKEKYRRLNTNKSVDLVSKEINKKERGSSAFFTFGAKIRQPEHPV